MILLCHTVCDHGTVCVTLCMILYMYHTFITYSLPTLLPLPLTLILFSRPARPALRSLSYPTSKTCTSPNPKTSSSTYQNARKHSPLSFAVFLCSTAKQPIRTTHWDQPFKQPRKSSLLLAANWSFCKRLYLMLVLAYLGIGKTPRR